MDIVSFTDSENNQVMIFEDSKPSVVVDIDDAALEVADEMVDDKSYLHIKKENGVTLTLVCTNTGMRQLVNAFVNMARTAEGKPQIDYLAVLDKVMREMGHGE